MNPQLLKSKYKAPICLVKEWQLLAGGARGGQSPSRLHTHHFIKIKEK